MAFVDISLELTSDGYYDIFPSENGDIRTTEGFDTTILLSLFLERRADSSEMAPAERRRGWWGNVIADNEGFEVGSKLWLLEQSRMTQKAINNSEDWAQESVDWFVEDSILRSVSAESIQQSTDALLIEVTLVRFDSKTETRLYNAWEATAV